MTWYNRDGKRSDPLDTGNLYGPVLSPDGGQAVVPIVNQDGLSADLWSFDLTRGTKNRLTSGPGLKQSPAWQPDGQSILFSLSPDIYRIRNDGTRTTEKFFGIAGSGTTPHSICRDGRYLAYMWGKSGLPSIWILPLTGEQKPFALVDSQYWNGAPAFSPDCKWVAYQTNETGQYEVYITHFPDGAGRYRVSTQGGFDPRWRGDGKELFYFSPDQNSILAVSVDEKAKTILLGAPRSLFRIAGRIATLGQYDVTADGQRFLVTEPNLPSGTVLVTLVTNWDAALKKR